jgi:hypothetical protein
MAKPNFSGVYTLKSSENEDAFLKAQGVSWVLRKAAKAVGSKRVLIEHSCDNLKIKAGLVDLEYVIGGAPMPTSFMGFEFTDSCAWHSDGVALIQTKLFTDGSKVTTVRTLSSDRQLLTYAHRWVDKNGGSEVRSTQVLQRVGEMPSGSAAAAAAAEAGGDDSVAAPPSAPTPLLGALSLNTLDSFVTGYETPPDGYATPPEEMPENFSHDELVRQLQSTKDGCAPLDLGEASAGQDACGEHEVKDLDPTVVKLKWMWADAGVAGVTSKLAQANPWRWSKALSPEDLKTELQKQAKARPVLISLLTYKHRMTFADPAACAAWIDESLLELRSDVSQLQKQAASSSSSSSASAPASTAAAPQRQGKSKSEGVLAVWRFVAPAYCVYFMRRHATTSWKHKNLFVASAYARRASQLPHQTSAMQESISTYAHPRREASYHDLATTGALSLPLARSLARSLARARARSFSLSHTQTHRCVNIQGAGGSSVPVCVSAAPAAGGGRGKALGVC